VPAVIRREIHQPGSMGNQKLNPRNSSVAASPIGTATPIMFNVHTEVASKMPRPPGTMPTVRNTLEIMKLAKTAAAGAVVPSD
jgi:hypothetical protein